MYSSERKVSTFCSHVMSRDVPSANFLPSIRTVKSRVSSRVSACFERPVLTSRQLRLIVRLDWMRCVFS